MFTERDWRVEEDARVIKNFAEIKNDNARFEKAKELINQQQKEISTVVGGKSGSRSLKDNPATVMKLNI